MTTHTNTATTAYLVGEATLMGSLAVQAISRSTITPSRTQIATTIKISDEELDTVRAGLLAGETFYL